MSIDDTRQLEGCLWISVPDSQTKSRQLHRYGLSWELLVFHHDIERAPKGCPKEHWHRNEKCNRLYSLFVQVHEEIKMAKCGYGMMFILCISNCSVVEESKGACTQKKKWSLEQNQIMKMPVSWFRHYSLLLLSFLWRGATKQRTWKIRRARCWMGHAKRG